MRSYPIPLPDIGCSWDWGFIHRSDSSYDDSPAERYQFPIQYLGRVQQCIGDWIVYHEPRKIPETRGYFAVAKVQQVNPDSAMPGMYLALIEPGSYLDFARPVSFQSRNSIVERGLLNDEGRISGRAQSAVRPLSSVDFDRILSLGLNDDEPLLPRRDDDLTSGGFSGIRHRSLASTIGPGSAT